MHVPCRAATDVGNINLGPIASYVVLAFVKRSSFFCTQKASALANAKDSRRLSTAARKSLGIFTLLSGSVV